MFLLFLVWIWLFASLDVEKGEGGGGYYDNEPSETSRVDTRYGDENVLTDRFAPGPEDRETFVNGQGNAFVATNADVYEVRFKAFLVLALV